MNKYPKRSAALTNWENAILLFKNSLNASNDFSSRNGRGGQFSGLSTIASPGNISFKMRCWFISTISSLLDTSRSKSLSRLATTGPAEI